jgi:phage/plasmid-like protein (TIGR03299 family)
MIYVGETPWHKLGVKLDKPPTTLEAMIAAGMDWEVGQKSLVTCDGEPVDGALLNYRISDGRHFGVVGKSTHPIQNRDAFKWFDPFLANGEATIETAGSLFEGKRVWVLAKLSRDPSIIVKGDAVQKYILLANSHDGSTACRMGFVPIRVVCNNTLSLAVGDSASKLVRIRHTKNAVDMLEAIRETMNAANATFEATAEQYRFLSTVKVTGDDLAKFVNVVFKRPAKPKKAATPPTVADVLANPEVSAPSIVDEILNAKPAEHVSVDDLLAETAKDFEARSIDIIRENFESGAGANLRGVKGTWWGAYNAMTEFLTHQRGKTDENRLAAQFNDAKQYNTVALKTAVEMATAASTSRSRAA